MNRPSRLLRVTAPPRTRFPGSPAGQCQRAAPAGRRLGDRPPARLRISDRHHRDGPRGRPGPDGHRTLGRPRHRGHARPAAARHEVRGRSWSNRPTAGGRALNLCGLWRGEPPQPAQVHASALQNWVAGYSAGRRVSHRWVSWVIRNRPLAPSSVRPGVGAAEPGRDQSPHRSESRPPSSHAANWTAAATCANWSRGIPLGEQETAPSGR